MIAAAERPFILVLAGVNGAGKSSVGGSLLAGHGLSWYNPDSYARELVGQLGLDPDKANERAWEFGRSRLEAAMSEGGNFAFETTLGGRTMTDMLAAAAGSHNVMMLFCGLDSQERHIARVRLRVAHGGHDIPEHKIHERWVSSRLNLISLLPRLARLQVFDNSAEAAPGQEIPDPVLVLETMNGRMVFPEVDDFAALAATPVWARPIVQAAIELSSS